MTLSVSGLSKAFATTPVLSAVDLEVASGDLVAILGASGSGKTTLLRLICGFERADAGRIVLNGQPVSDTGPRVPSLHVPAERRSIGYVAQEGALFPHLSVADNILFGLKRRARRPHAAAEWLERVGLPAAYASRPPHALSGGEQQRVALARALAPAPKLVLLDEPFSALDAALRVETRAAVAAALQAAGATALLVTHDQSEALSMGRQVAVLRHGRLVQVATPQTLYRVPVDADLAGFVGEAVLLAGDAADGMVRCALGHLPISAGPTSGPVDVLIRPEQLRLDIARHVPLRARVRSETFYGHDASIGLDLLGEGPALPVTARVSGHVRFAPGMEVGVAVEGEVVTYQRTAAKCPKKGLLF